MTILEILVSVLIVVILFFAINLYFYNKTCEKGYSSNLELQNKQSKINSDSFRINNSRQSAIIQQTQRIIHKLESLEEYIETISDLIKASPKQFQNRLRDFKAIKKLKKERGLKHD